MLRLIDSNGSFTAGWSGGKVYGINKKISVLFSGFKCVVKKPGTKTVGGVPTEVINEYPYRVVNKF